ncbi:MAG: hypothetical protein D4R80_07640 [Deltaproteobacteria bacterium]|nr:MAG: hypothetical protein D4R80_07640 [Deltaproteobacteria bacterium]
MRVASSVPGEWDAETYTVYHFDYIRQVSEPVGKVVERRRKDRGNNVGSLLKLAQKIYPTTSLDSRLVITPE